MKAALGAYVVGSGLVLLGAVSYVQATGSQQTGGDVPRAASEHRAFLDRYCVTCHSDAGHKAERVPISLQGIDVTDIGANAETWEKVVRKLRGGVMPPSGSRRPDEAASTGFVAWLERELDRTAAARPNPGRTDAYHRLNRAEYRNAVRDLLAVDLDVSSLLPADDASYGFDNIAGVLRFSPTLMERYLTAAKKVSQVAVSTPLAFPAFEVFRVADDLPQDDWVEGLPFGTRGGSVIRYHFPRDGEYVVRVRLTGFRAAAPEQLEVSLNGDQLKVFTLGRAAAPNPADDNAGPANANVPEVRFAAKAGPGQIAVTFLSTTPALLETLAQPFFYPYRGGGTNLGSTRGTYVRSVEVAGPFEDAGVEETPSRQRIFVCRPADVSERSGAGPAGPRKQSEPSGAKGPPRVDDERPCAKSILSTLARRAYRRPVTDADVQVLLGFYDSGRTGGNFDAGIELAIRRLLVSPQFLFRIQADPPTKTAGTTYRIDDVELASRLSFFLWSSIPDDELLHLAEQRRLHEPTVLESQVRRMLADGRSQAMVENFVGQWLLLRNVPALRPDPYKDPDFDESLRQAMRRETELFFAGILREDRSVLELLTANYTFLNERLAKHYGIPHVYGSHFRRVMLPEGSVRGGLLGQASILAATSHANRTSPVLRGKWILENVLGTPPPAPPPNVPALQEPKDGGQAMTMRERMAQHRSNPVCASCHMMMDPLGLALENFDYAGRWRAVEEAFDSRIASFTRMDTSGTLPDGTPFEGPLELRQALLGRSDNFIATLTEKLLTYALGRGVEYYDMPAVRAITREGAQQNHRFSSLLLGIVNSLPFQSSTVSPSN